MKTKIRFGFKHNSTKKDSSFQTALFMIWKEYYDDAGEVEFAKVLFEIKGRELRKMLKSLQEEQRGVNS